MTYTSNRQFEQELAADTVRFFENGHDTASAKQIARAHFGNSSYNLTVVMDIKDRLKRIKYLLDERYGLPVVLVHQDAYTIISAGGPITRADAMRCLPSGKGRVSDGIHLCRNQDDLIYEVSIEMSLRRSAGAEKRNMERLLDTHSRGFVSDETLVNIASDTAERRAVDSPTPAVLARIIAQRQQRMLES